MLNLHKYKDTLTLHLKQCNNVHYYNCNLENAAYKKKKKKTNTAVKIEY